MLLVVRWGGGGGGWLAGVVAVASPAPVVAQPQQREVGAVDLGHGGRGLTAATRTETTHDAL